MKKIKVGSDFSGVGAFDQALKRLGVNYETVFACDMDKYARDTFIHNYGEPKYYPKNVYDREIPSESLDIYMTSPPCQAFSLAGKRLGKEDKRGVLFFNSHEFIQVNKPRFFIFENVKGLLSDDGGRTFQEWINMLGGKSVNGLPVLFAHDDSVPYHLYWKVLNAKHHGVPQNRERVFLIGIRDDVDNRFQFPKEEYLTNRLKDVLQDPVDDKYFLSEKMLELITFQEKTNGEIANLNKGGERGSVYDLNSKAMSCLSATDYKQPKMIKVGNVNPSGIGINGNVFDEEGISPTLWSGHGEGLKIKSATFKGFEEAREGGSINFSVLNSETRRGRVGKGVAQTLDTGCNQAVIEIKSIVKPLQIGQSKQTYAYKNDTIIGKENQEAFTIRAGQPNGVVIEKTNDSIKILDCYNNNIRKDDCCGTITQHCSREGMTNGFKVIDNYKIRRLTPRECFRLMDFPDTFTWPVSDSQAYKQAGNSIVVNVLYKILKQLPL